MKYGKQAVFSALTIGALAMGASAMAQAESIAMDKIEPTIKYRQSVMSAMGGMLGIAVGQLRDGITDGPDLDQVAATLQALSTNMPALFPEGTDFGETHAKAAVWSEREAFEKAATETEEAIDAFAMAVDGGDRKAMLVAFKKVGDSCKSCHKDFREKPKH